MLHITQVNAHIIGSYSENKLCIAIMDEHAMKSNL